MIRTIHLLGLDFADLTAAEAAAAIADRPDGATFAYVVTPNADHLVRLDADPALAEIYRGAWLRLLDSRVVAGMAWLRGLAVPAVAPGSDVTELLLRRHVRAGEQITIIGLRAARLPELMARCGLSAPAHHDPPMGFEHDPTAFAEAVAFVCRHKSRFVFLAVGSPRQERLAVALARAGATGTALCIGASLDFLAGTEQRAPLWIRHAGLEWAYRLARDPTRLARRYLVDSPRIVTLLFRRRPEPLDRDRRRAPARHEDKYRRCAAIDPADAYKDDEHKDVAHEDVAHEDVAHEDVVHEDVVHEDNEREHAGPPS